MRSSSTLARIAFICNIFFLVCLLLQRYSAAQESNMVSLAAIMGLLLGMGLLNPLSNIVNGFYLLQRKPLFSVVPRWLFWCNLGFLILQIIYLLHTRL